MVVVTCMLPKIEWAFLKGVTHLLMPFWQAPALMMTLCPCQPNSSGVFCCLAGLEGICSSAFV